MTWRPLTLLALVSALYGAPAAAHVRCGPLKLIEQNLTGPLFSEKIISVWKAAGLLWQYYSNSTTGTWTVIYSGVNAYGQEYGCVVTSGTATPEEPA